MRVVVALVSACIAAALYFGLGAQREGGEERRSGGDAVRQRGFSARGLPACGLGQGLVRGAGGAGAAGDSATRQRLVAPTSPRARNPTAPPAAPLVAQAPPVTGWQRARAWALLLLDFFSGRYLWELHCQRREWRAAQQHLAQQQQQEQQHLPLKGTATAARPEDSADEAEGVAPR